MSVSDASRWAEIERLFDQAAALPDDAQATFLQHSCNDDSLRAEVAALLAAARKSGDFLERAAPAASAPAATLTRGALLGAWRIERLIGRGGMSEVYLAQRADGQYEQSAALKLLSPELLPHAETFLRERQILAQLQHPLICRLLDGGVAGDGRPYMVMEYVEGQNLVQYCARHQADLPERLRLFRQVCEAVAYAHRNLVVHRDLKPSNILVSAEGAVKLLDFGIARLLDAQRGADSARTQHLTPGYAAPEQLKGEAVTTATDCYALGILLHELLAGATPFRMDSLPLALAVERVVHDTPLALSASADANSATPVPARLLRGDLDAIAAKALRKEPEARYASAAELLADLDRHERHEPVSARGDALGYVLRRFVQRHRVLVAAGGAVLAVLAGAVVRVSIEAERARHERDTATLAAERAQAVTEFLTKDLLGSANAWTREGKDFAVKDALAAAAKKVDERFADKPEVAAQVHATLGDTYFSLGQSAEAFQHLRRANDLYKNSGDPAPGARAAVLDVLASQLLSAGQTQEGCALYGEMLDLRQREFAPEHLEVLRARSRMAMCLSYGGRQEDAARAYREVLEVAVRTGAPEDFVISELTLQLAHVLNELARWDEAEPLFRQIREHRIKTRGADHISVGVMGLLLGPALYHRGGFDEAEQELTQGLALVRKHVGEDQTYVPWFIWMLGTLNLERGRFTEAAALLSDALARYAVVAAQTGQDDAALSELQYGIAETELGQGRAAAAIARIRQALERSDRLNGPAHSSAMWPRVLLADALRQDGQAGAAQEALDAISPAALKAQPDRHPVLARHKRVAGLLAQAAGRRDEARQLLVEALAIFELRHGAAHPRTRQLRAELEVLQAPASSL